MKLLRRFSKICLCEALLVFLNTGVCGNVLYSVPKEDALIEPNDCDSYETFKFQSLITGKKQEFLRS